MNLDEFDFERSNNLMHGAARPNRVLTVLLRSFTLLVAILLLMLGLARPDHAIAKNPEFETSHRSSAFLPHSSEKRAALKLSDKLFPDDAALDFCGHATAAFGLKTSYSRLDCQAGLRVEAGKVPNRNNPIRAPPGLIEFKGHLLSFA